MYDYCFCVIVCDIVDFECVLCCWIMILSGVGDVEVNVFFSEECRSGLF